MVDLPVVSDPVRELPRISVMRYRVRASRLMEVHWDSGLLFVLNVIRTILEERWIKWKWLWRARLWKIVWQA